MEGALSAVRDPLLWAGIALGAVGAGLLALQPVFAFPELPAPEAPVGEPIAAADTEMIDLFELQRNPGSVGSYSGFCLAVEAHLRALKLPYNSRKAFDDKFPPRGKAPFLEHLGKDGRVVTVSDSDAMNAYLLKAASATPGCLLIADSKIEDAARRGTIWMLKRVTTDRLYFVMMYAAVAPGAWGQGGAGSDSMPWPVGPLFHMYLRRFMLEQCRSAAGGIGRFALEEALASVEPDLDVMEEAVARLAGTDGFLSGLALPCSNEVAMWAHLVPAIFDDAKTDFGQAILRRPSLSAWLLRVAVHLFPERVDALECAVVA